MQIRLLEVPYTESAFALKGLFCDPKSTTASNPVPLLPYLRKFKSDRPFDCPYYWAPVMASSLAGDHEMDPM